MVHAEHLGLPYELLKKLLTTAGGAVTIISFFIAFQYILNLDFECPCDPAYNGVYFALYLLLPFGIMVCILILRDSKCARICRQFRKRHCKCCHRDCKCFRREPDRCCDACEGNCKYYGWSRFYCCFACKRLLIAAFAGAMWIIMVFLDGDPLACLLANSITESGEQIACLDKSKLTPQQNVTIKHYKNISCVICLCVILAFLLVAWLITCLTAGRCKPHYESLYEEYLQEETEATLKEILRKDAENKAVRICQLQIQVIENRDSVEKMWEDISDPAFYQRHLSLPVEAQPSTGTQTSSPDHLSSSKEATPSEHLPSSDHRPSSEEATSSEHLPSPDHRPSSEEATSSKHQPSSEKATSSEHQPSSEDAPLSDHSPSSGAAASSRGKSSATVSELSPLLAKDS